ncbi:MAG: TAXI family TRAP transporter solute-binding subunit [Deltaproteobacteria bacterium]|nr:TAXI family TRAP transporter solute-binding subunit [Deltaproteobacteria bacterium]
MRRLLTLLAATTFCAATAFPAFAAGHNLVIASGNSGGTYYYIGAGMAKLLSQKLPDVEVTTEATTGSPVENGTFTSQSVETMGIFTLDGAYAAKEGDKSKGFRKPLTNLGMIQAGHDLLLYWITKESSGIKSLADAKGKRIGLPSVGNTAYFQALALLEAYGLKKGDYKGIPMTYAEQGDGLKDGNIDIMCAGGGIPQAAALDVTTTHDCVFLSIDDDKIADLKEKYPYWWVSDIPANVYRNQDKPVRVFTSKVCLFANTDMDVELAYQITKALAESTKELAEIHAEGSKWSAENTKPLFEEQVVPFHPGATKYYNELWKK